MLRRVLYEYATLWETSSEARVVDGADLLGSAVRETAKVGFSFQGISKMISLDNGPVAKSQVFQQVMRYLNIDVRAQLPKAKDGRGHARTGQARRTRETATRPTTSWYPCLR
jgi:hypothetical protein